MKTISVKDMIDFKRRSERSKKTFIINMKKDTGEQGSGSGMDYWSSGISAINNSFKRNTLQPLFDKKRELIERYESATLKSVKTKQTRNIEIINTYSQMNSKKWKPDQNVKFEAVSKSNFVINIGGINVKMRPSAIFTFNMLGINQVGGIWFVSQKDGFKRNELGMFCDLLFRYLKINYSERYEINNSYCTAVDVLKGYSINYQKLQESTSNDALKLTIDEIKALF